MSKLKYKDTNILTKALNLKFVVLLSNLIFQGMRYMSFGERIYKIGITILLALLVNVYIGNLFVSIVIGHLLNYILNGQFYVVFRYLSSKRTMSRKDLNEYVDLMEKAIRFFKPKDVLVIGSFCRGKMGKSSDLDIRLYHRGEFISSFSAYMMATYLRFMGLILKFPIDIFCFSELKFLDKLDKKEVPVNFLENAEILKKYPTSVNYQPHLKVLKIA